MRVIISGFFLISFVYILSRKKEYIDQKVFFRSFFFLLCGVLFLLTVENIRSTETEVTEQVINQDHSSCTDGRVSVTDIKVIHQSCFLDF